jgi:hypothetical protein
MPKSHDPKLDAAYRALSRAAARVRRILAGQKRPKRRTAGRRRQAVGRA